MKKLFTFLFFFSFVALSWSQDHTVQTVGTTFNPSNLTVFAGQSVQWVNTGGTHNVNGTQASYPDNPASFGNAVGAGWTYDFTFDTPGFYNYHCDPHLGIGMIGTVTVLNPAYPIGLVTADSDANGEADSVNVACSLTGVVYGIDMQGGGNVQFTIIDGNNDGIGVFSSNDYGYTVTEGDEVTISGTINSFNGLAQINPDTIIVNSTGNTLVAPTVVTVLDESTESQLIRLENLTLVDPGQWDNAGSNNIDVTDGTNTYLVRIDSDVADLNAAPAPTGMFNLTGIGGQFDASDPYTEGYQLLPRYLADLEEIVDPCGIGTLTADADMDGQADSVGVTCTVTGVVYGIDLNGNEGLSFTIIDAGGDGIAVFNFVDVDAYVVTEGDEVTVTGEITSFNGLAQIQPSSIVLNSQGNALVNPTDVTVLDESTESQLIRLINVTLVDPAQWDNSGSNNIDVTDGTNTYLVRIDSDVADLNAAPAPAGAFNITGIGGQFDSSDPYTEGYQLLPRYLADLEEIVPVTPELIITGVVDPEPANGSGGDFAGAKSVELYAVVDIPDLSIYGVGAANNGGGSDGIEFTFPPDAIAAGTCITYTDSSDLADFMTFFGVAPTYLVSSAASINGDDAIELFKNGEVIDVYGDINVDGNGEVWEYLDGWAYRKDGTGPNGGTFNPNNWVYSGVEALQSTTFTTNAEFANPYPICTYSPDAPAVISAVDDVVNLPIDVVSSIDVLANDDTPNGVTSMNVLSVSLNSIATPNGTTDITYTPNLGFCGPDEVIYEICDANGCDTATVSITIDCPPSYPAYPIGLVTADADGNGVGDSLNVTCELTGVVYGVDLRGGDGLSFTIIGSDGEGINVFSFEEVDAYAVLEGDEITVRGTIIQFNGLTEIGPDQIIFNSAANPLVTPTDVTALGEDTESQLIRMVNMTLVDPAQWTNTGSGFNVDITDGTNTFAMRIDNDVNLYGTAAPALPFNVTGIGGQFDSSDPYTEGYQIFPRYIEDIEEINATNDLDLGNQIKMMPNPAHEYLDIQSEIQLDQIRIYNMLGQEVKLINQPNLTETLNVNNWQSGIYVVSFISNDKIFTAQFVKK